MYNDDGIDTFEDIYVYRNNKQINSINDSSDGRAVCIMPHLKDNKKVYISDNLSTHGQIEKKDKIKLNIYIPTSEYVYGEDDEESAYRFISYSKVNLHLQIDEIADNDMLYNTTASDIIYIPYDMYYKLIMTENGKIGENIPMNTELKRQPFSFNNYVIVTDNKQIQDVYVKLLELDSGLDVFSNKMYYIDQSETFFDSLVKELISTLGISILCIGAFITVFYYQMHSHKKEIQLLMYNGISKKEIKKIWEYEAMIHAFMWLISCSVLSLIKNNILIFIISMIIIVNLYIIEYIIIRYHHKQIHFKRE